MNELLTPKELAEMQAVDKSWNNPRRLWECMLDATVCLATNPFCAQETRDAWKTHELFLRENENCSSVDALRNLKQLNLA